MRLVSAIYGMFYPFDEMGLFDECVDTMDPSDLKEGDVLVVWGGEDISPALYNKSRSSRGHGDITPSRRDRIEWALMQRAKEINVPIIGICRGAQMMCAMEGGFLYQHVDNHGGNHTVFTKDGITLVANSLHHQMMVPRGEHELIAWTTTRGRTYYDEETVFTQHELLRDPEFIYYPKIKGFAIQWHPEMMDFPCATSNYVKEFIMEKLK